MANKNLFKSFLGRLVGGTDTVNEARRLHSRGAVGWGHCRPCKQLISNRSWVGLRVLLADR